MTTKMIVALAVVGMLASGSPLYAKSVGLEGDTTVTVQADISVQADATASTSGNGAGEENTLSTDEEIAGTIVLTRGSLSAEILGNVTAAFEVESDTDLKAYATVLMQADENVSDVSLSEDMVSVRYQQPAELFGFIESSLTVEASVDAQGTVTVSYPWYSFLYSTNKAEVEAAVEAAVPSVSVNTSTGLSASTQAEILEKVHAALQSEASVVLNT